MRRPGSAGETVSKLTGCHFPFCRGERQRVFQNLVLGPSGATSPDSGFAAISAGRPHGSSPHLPCGTGKGNFEKSSAVSLTLDPDSSIMGFDDPFDDGQPESHPSAVPAASRVRAVEPVENVRKIVRLDSNAMIANRELHCRILSPRRNLDNAAVPGVFDGILEEVDDSTTDPELVGIDSQLPTAM